MTVKQEQKVFLSLDLYISWLQRFHWQEMYPYTVPKSGIPTLYQKVVSLHCIKKWYPYTVPKSGIPTLWYQYTLYQQIWFSAYKPIMSKRWINSNLVQNMIITAAYASMVYCRFDIWSWDSDNFLGQISCFLTNKVKVAVSRDLLEFFYSMNPTHLGPW